MSTLTNEKIEELNNIGFIWSIRGKRVIEDNVQPVIKKSKIFGEHYKHMAEEKCDFSSLICTAVDKMWWGRKYYHGKVKYILIFAQKKL